MRTRNWSPAPGGRGGAGRGALRAGRRRRARPAPGGRRAQGPAAREGARRGGRAAPMLFSVPEAVCPPLAAVSPPQGLPGLRGGRNRPGKRSARLPGRPSGKNRPLGKIRSVFLFAVFFQKLAARSSPRATGGRGGAPRLRSPSPSPREGTSHPEARTHATARAGAVAGRVRGARRSPQKDRLKLKRKGGRRSRPESRLQQQPCGCCDRGNAGFAIPRGAERFPLRRGPLRDC